MCLNGTRPGASSLVAFVSLIRPGASLLVAFVSLIGFFSLASFPSAGCFDFCLTWSNRGHLVSFLAFTTTRSVNATVLQKGVGGYFCISQCLSVPLCFCIVFVSFKPDIESGDSLGLAQGTSRTTFVVQTCNLLFGLAPKPSQYFSRCGLGGEDFRCLKCGPRAIRCIQEFQKRALVIPSSTARVVAVPFDGVSDFRLGFRHQI
jgi:hypothetical protein